MTENIRITGCIFSQCDKAPYWLIDAFAMLPGGAQQAAVDLPVCVEHVAWFSWQRNAQSDTGWARTMGYPVRIEDHTGRPPRKLLVAVTDSAQQRR